MLVMAIDHIREMFNNGHGHPLDLKTTTPIFYFTRWITHFCAPVFVLLAGISAYIMGLKMTKPALSKFLITRGCWLIFAELCIVTLGITFNPLYRLFILQVIWATGVSMIILGIFVRFSSSVIPALAIIILCFHNLLDYAEDRPDAKIGFLWDLIHVGNKFNRFPKYPIGADHSIAIVYAFLPWTGIMFLGYWLGKLYAPAMDVLRRRKILVYLGSGMILLFVLLRWINGYGDPTPWSGQSSSLYSFLSFINVNKYPPSLMYTCIMLGPALIFLGLAEGISNRLTAFISVYGRVPFFYYLVHFYFIHCLVAIAFFASGYGLKDIMPHKSSFLFQPPGFGFDLWVTYAVWLLVVLIMYPLCKNYDRYKNSHSQWWLKYL